MDPGQRTASAEHTYSLDEIAQRVVPGGVVEMSTCSTSGEFLPGRSVRRGRGEHWLTFARRLAYAPPTRTVIPIASARGRRGGGRPAGRSTRRARSPGGDDGGDDGPDRHRRLTADDLLFWRLARAAGPAYLVALEIAFELWLADEPTLRRVEAEVAARPDRPLRALEVAVRRCYVAREREAVA